MRDLRLMYRVARRALFRRNVRKFYQELRRGL